MTTQQIFEILKNAGFEVELIADHVYVSLNRAITINEIWILIDVEYNQITRKNDNTLVVTNF